MTTQNADEKWITEQDNAPRASFRDCMRAALARGREQGRKDANGALASLNGEAHDALDAAGVEHAPTVFDRVRALIADRDRLAKRVQELEADIAGADEFLRSTAWENPVGATTVEARVRLAYEAGVTDGAHNEAMVVRSLESRLAATEARLAALVEAAHDYVRAVDPRDYNNARDRLAALRAPAWKPTLAQEEYIGKTVRDGYGVPDPDPRVQHWIEQCRAVTDALATARREREEARADRDALRARLDEVEARDRLLMPTLWKWHNGSGYNEKLHAIMDELGAALRAWGKAS